MWVRAVWKEGEKEFEDTIPSYWIINGFVRWPVGIHHSRAMKEKRPVQDNWKKFELIKKKMEDGKEFFSVVLIKDLSSYQH